MPSPFNPAMDPYLEHPAYWPEFHSKLISALQELLLDRLPPGYDAMAGEQMRLVEAPSTRGPERVHRVIPDVALTRRADQPRRPEGGVATLERPVLEPLFLPAPEQVRARQYRIEIVNLPDRRLVTVIELLSPSNKRGSGHREYLGKRRAVLRQDANLIEIDLMRDGPRPPFLASSPQPTERYVVCVARHDKPERHELYAWPATDPLPVVPVPLRPGDGDVTLDLAEAVRVAYDRGRYERRLDYDAAPSPEPADSDRRR